MQNSNNITSTPDNLNCWGLITLLFKGNQALGGEQCAQGNFSLPPQIARKPIEDIASKKRAEYRRRYQLLEQLEEQLAAHFTTELI